MNTQTPPADRQTRRMRFNRLRRQLKELRADKHALTEQITHITDELTMLYSAIEQSPASVVLTDTNGAIQYANPKFTEITGYRLDEVHGKNPRLLKSGDSPSEVYKQLWETITAGGEWHGEFHNRKKNGELYWEKAWISPVRNARGEIVRFLAIKEDITARKLAEQALEETNHQLRALNKIMLLTNSSLDIQRILYLVADELARLLGLSHAAALVVNPASNMLQLWLPGADGKLYADLVEIPMRGNRRIEDLVAYRRPLVIDQSLHDSELEFLRGKFLTPQMHALLMVPLFAVNQLRGVLLLSAEHEHRFSPVEMTLTESTSLVVSQALENSLLHERLAQNNQKLKETVDEQTEELRRLNGRMANILNSMTDSLIVAFEDGTIDITNRAFEQQFGYITDELFGESLSVLVEPEQRSKLDQVVQQVINTGVMKTVQISARRKDGTLFDADISFVKTVKSPSVIICSLHDISRLKEVERMKNHFISMVSHELRTPITTILLSAGNLRQYYERMTEERRRRAVDQVETQAKVLADLVEAVLDISRLENRKGMEQPRSLVDMRRMLESIIQEMQPQADAKSLRLRAEIDAQPLRIMGEETDFARIWRNLISNAIKYTSEGGITVRFGITYNDEELVGWKTHFSPWLAPGGDYLLGEVEDTGHGVSPENLEKLFTRFFRGWAAQSNIPGTGLGLAFVRELLQHYNGDIRVTSELNRGSCFSFWLPLEPVQTKE